MALGLPLVSLHSAEVTALVQIAAGLLHRAARTARAVVRPARPVRSDSLKYDLRVLLPYLGFIGGEFRAQREQLLHRVSGSAAWKVPPDVDLRAAVS